MSGDEGKALEAGSERQRRLDELKAGKGPAWEARYRPGSFGCHELLDRTAMVMGLVDDYVLSHPSCALEEDWYLLAERAVSALNELYQRVGERHLGVEAEADGGAGPDRRA